jgi:predicted RNA-binding Zn-ribbon protein involved in translation (DUF1610 family)
MKLRWTPKLPVAKVVRLYEVDARGLRDEELLDDVGWRLLARCADVLLVSESRLPCPECGTIFEVPWIGESDDRVSTCPTCEWSITTGEYHASFKDRDLYGVGAREAYSIFVGRFPGLTTYTERMLAIDRLVHTVHITGGLAARNLFEGRARTVLATLDSLARAK